MLTRIVFKNSRKGFKAWLAQKLVNFAQWLYPESDEVKAFYMKLLSDFVITGKYVTRVDWEGINLEERAEIPAFVRCSRCGKQVSNVVISTLPEGIVVRAWVECPECIEAHSPSKGGGNDADVQGEVKG